MHLLRFYTQRKKQIFLLYNHQLDVLNQIKLVNKVIYYILFYNNSKVVEEKQQIAALKVNSGLFQTQEEREIRFVAPPHVPAMLTVAR